MALPHSNQDMNRGVVEEIKLENSMSSYEYEDDDELHIKKVNGKLGQIDKTKGIASQYSIVNDYYLLVSEVSIFSRRKYWLHLGCLKDKPKRSVIVAWRWLATIVWAGMAAMAAYKFIPTMDIPHKQYILSGIFVVSGVLSAVGLFIFFYQSCYRHIYYSRRGNVPLAGFMPDRPDRKQYRLFIQALQSYIYRAHKHIEQNNSLAMELREHRRLNASGIITDKQYSHAKDRIFAGFSHKKI